MPSQSTMGDVRRVLGDPDEANDVAAYTQPYPGDETARKPVFTFTRLMPGWRVLIYFSKYCFRAHPPDPNGNRLCSIDLVPERRLEFSAIRFSAAFTKNHVQAVDGAWDEYSDQTGLQYDVYTAKTPYGGNESGDLFRISYGLPPTPNLRLGGAKP